VRHKPDVAAPVDDAEAVITLALEVSEQPRAYTPPSDADTDQLDYFFYVMLFISLRRPVTIMGLKFEDVFFPDMRTAENQELFNRYVVLGSHIHSLFCEMAGPRGGPCVCSWAALLKLLTQRSCFLLHSDVSGCTRFCDSSFASGLPVGFVTNWHTDTDTTGS